MADLAQLASSNFPTGTEAIGNSLDNYIRAISAIIRSTNALASATIAAASTTDIASADGEAVTVTGGSTINSFGTGFTGCVREVRFTGTPTIVSSAVIGLPGGVNLVTSINDFFVFRCISPGVWWCIGGSRDPTALRRDGDGSLTATYFNANGAVPAFRGAGASVILGTNADGVVYLRPRGAGVTASQTTVDTNGTVGINSVVSDYIVTSRSGYIFSHTNLGNGQLGIFDATAGAFALNYNTASGGSWSARGDFTASGNVTGGSDERVKTNWRPLPDDLIERLAEVKCGIYDRTDMEATQVGLGAQSLRKFLPWAVSESEDGFLSVAYGNTAAVAAVKLSQRLIAAEARISELEAR